MTRYAPVPPPPVDRPRVTLLAAAYTPQGETYQGAPVRWQEGVEYDTQASGMVGLTDPCDPATIVVREGCDCTTPERPPNGPSGPEGEFEPRSSDPGGSGDQLCRRIRTAATYAISSFECSLLGMRGTEYADLATATLNAELPRAIEHEFWTGANAQAAGHTENRYLEGAEVVDLTPLGGAVDAVAALGMLEGALAQVYSGTALIHVSRYGFPFLAVDQPLTRTGNLVETYSGARIIPGIGYPGTGPEGVVAAANTTWVYGTAMATVRVGAPELPTVEDVRGAMIDRTVNRLIVNVRAPFTADWDGCGTAFAVLMKTPA